ENTLASPADITEWRCEGDAAITFPRGRLRLENAYERDTDQGRHANFVLWCDRDFPDNIVVRWEFKPLSDRGLAMIWIAAAGRNGEDLFDPALDPRDGDYPQYHHGDINALHGSYFRRNPQETSFRTCNLRKSYGFHMVAQGGDPLPDCRDVEAPYTIEVLKWGPHVRFSMNGVILYHWVDDGVSYGPVLEAGKIGFRQMAGLIAEYGKLEVRSVSPEREVR
ncbi:MAG: DUF1961 family protein, partial [bacterium]